ncbi:MAG: glycosyltransferase [Dialister sp.]|nr:glycosyltransferase [Dialister sp.]
MPSTSPFFHIILPTHERPELVLRAVRSVLEQDYTHYRLYIYNDGSIKSYDALKDLIEGQEKVQYAFHKNVGLNATLNKGLDEIFSHAKDLRREYFLIVSDDDYLLPGGLRMMAEEISSFPEEHWFCFNCRLAGSISVSNQDYTEYCHISYRQFRRHYHGDKQKVFRLDTVRNIRYPAKYFKNGHELLFYERLPCKIQIIPKTVRVIEYQEDGLTCSTLYDDVRLPPILWKYFKANPTHLSHFFRLFHHESRRWFYNYFKAKWTKK